MTLSARLTAAAALIPRIAATGWMDRALTQPDMVVDDTTLLNDWP